MKKLIQNITFIYFILLSILISCTKIENLELDPCNQPKSNKTGPVFFKIKIESKHPSYPVYFVGDDSKFLYLVVIGGLPDRTILYQYDFNTKTSTILFEPQHLINNHDINKDGLIYMSTGYNLFFMNLNNLTPQYDFSEQNRVPIFNKTGDKIFWEYTNSLNKRYILCKDLLTNKIDTVKEGFMDYGSVSKDDYLYYSFFTQNAKYAIGKINTNFPYEYELVKEFDKYTPKSITCNKQNEDLLYFTDNLTGVIIELNVVTKSERNLTQKCYSYEEISCSNDGKFLLATKRYHKNLYDSEGRVSQYYQYDYSIVRFNLSTFSDEVIIP